MRNYPWHYVPIIRLVVPFIIGIILSLKIQLNLELLSIILFGLFILYFLFYKLTVTRKFKFEKWHGLVIFLMVAISSYILTKSNIGINNKAHFSNYIGKNSILICKAALPPSEKLKSYQIIVKVFGVVNNELETKCNGKAIIYLPKNNNSAKLEIGDVIVFKNYLNEIEPPGNPGQFDYKKFLSYKQINYQAFLKDGQWSFTGNNLAFKPYKALVDLRLQIINLLQTKIKGTDESAVATALLVGYQAELSPEIRQSFSSTGAMHVLAVSGLHVGIIFLVFSFIFKPVKMIKHGKLFYFLLNFIALWFYAMITGLSPSVLRACAMFSFVLIGQNVGRITNTYASLSFSAFVLLLINPFLITQVGFQLSYVAVLGIVSIQPPIYNLINSKRWWLIDKAWSLTAVSFAAQIATSPISLLYFWQFPVYFLISNLVVIPIATFIIYLGFTYLIFEAIGVTILADFLVRVLDFTITWLNKSILLIRDLPHGLIQEVYFSGALTIVIYIVLISAFLFLFLRKRLFLFSLLISVSILVSGITYWNTRNLLNQRIVFYSIRGNSLIGFFDGKDISFIGDKAILNNYLDLKYNTFRDVFRNGGKSKNLIKVIIGDSIKESNLIANSHFIQFYDKTILIIDKESEHISSKDKLHIDYILLRNNPYLDLAKLKNNFDFDALIIDQTNKYYRRNYWIKECMKHKINYIDLVESGALVVNLRN